ncbi:major facilitator superfamily transporter [Seiridium cupressi]
MASERTALLAEESEDVKVDWEGKDDPANPLNWRPRQKWGHVTVVSLLTFLVPLGATMFAPALSSAARDLRSQSESLTSLMLSIYILGWTLGPLVMAPFSEIYGRWAAYTLSNLLYLVFTVACALSPNAGTLIVFRFLAGAVGSTPLAIGGGTISDLIPVQERGFALSLYILGPILGPSVGPLAGGFLTDTLSWRWVFWILALLYAIVTAVQILYTRETFSATVLEKKASYLRESTGDPSFRSVLDDGLSQRQVFVRAIVRPTRMTLQSPINLLISLVSAYFNGALFLLLANFPTVFRTEYGFNASDIGLAFIGFGLGNIAGLALFTLTSDRFIQSRLRSGVSKPEDRLIPVVAACPLLAIGFFWYGWSAELHAHWIVPIIGSAFIGMGNVIFFSAIIGYLIDVFTIHAASAIAANIVIRSIGGTVLPLVGGSLYSALGWGWGSSVLGLVAVVLAPLMTLLYVYGESVRKRYPAPL